MIEKESGWKQTVAAGALAPALIFGSVGGFYAGAVQPKISKSLAVADSLGQHPDINADSVAARYRPGTKIISDTSQLSAVSGVSDIDKSIIKTMYGKNGWKSAFALPSGPGYVVANKKSNSLIMAHELGHLKDWDSDTAAFKHRRSIDNELRANASAPFKPAGYTKISERLLEGYKAQQPLQDFGRFVLRRH